MARCLNNPALLDNAQGKYIEAEPLVKRALAIFEKALGPEHPDMASRNCERGSDCLFHQIYRASAQDREPCQTIEFAIALGPALENVVHEHAA